MLDVVVFDDDDDVVVVAAICNMFVELLVLMSFVGYCIWYCILLVFVFVCVSVWKNEDDDNRETSAILIPCFAH